MKLILKKDVDHLGEAGAVVEVKPGFARNYLLPQGLAYKASPANIRLLEEEQKRDEERSRRDYLEARRRASQLVDFKLDFRARAGEDGKLFGSVTAADIAQNANEQELDFEFDRRMVVLDEPIKVVGDHRVPVRLHGEVELEILVTVERDED